MRILNIDATIKCTIYIYIKYQNFNKHIRYTIYETFDHIGEFNHDLNMIYPVNNFCRSSRINRTNQTSRIFLDTVNIAINYHFIRWTVLKEEEKKEDDSIETSLIRICVFPPISISPMHISVSFNETSMRIFPQFAMRFTTEERRIATSAVCIDTFMIHNVNGGSRYIPWEDKGIFVPKFTLPTYRYW